MDENTTVPTIIKITAAINITNDLAPSLPRSSEIWKTVYQDVLQAVVKHGIPLKYM